MKNPIRNANPRTLGLWFIAVCLVFFLMLLPGSKSNHIREVSYTEMIQFIQELPSDKEAKSTLTISGDRWELVQDGDEAITDRKSVV